MPANVSAQPSQTVLPAGAGQSSLPAVMDALLGALLQSGGMGGQPLSDVQLQQMLRKLMGLPDSFLELLQWLTTPNAKGATQTGLQAGQHALNATLQQLLANLGEPVQQQQLQQLLQQQLGNAQQQLGKLLGQPQATQQQQALQQISQLVSQLGGQVQSEPMAALQTLMVLYLPIQPQAPLRAWFQPGSGEPAGGDGDKNGQSGGGDDALMLAVTVPRLGTFHISVFLSAVNATEDSLLHLGYPETATAYLPPLKSHLQSTLETLTLPIRPVWSALTPSASRLESSTTPNSPEAVAAPRIMTFPSQGISAKAIGLGFIVAKRLLEFTP